MDQPSSSEWAALVAVGAARYAAVTSLDRWLHRQAVRAWRELKPRALQRSFVDGALPILAPALVRAQQVAAGVAAVTASQGVAALGMDAPPAPTIPGAPRGAQAAVRAVAADVPESGVALAVDPAGFAGYAAEGGELTSVLARPLVQTYVDLSHGLDEGSALRRGFESLDRLLTTEVHDTARLAEQTQLATVHEITYFVRMVEPGACGRCVILSGRRYRWSHGFSRHPNCRCSMAPMTIVDESQIPSPMQIFQDMTAEQRKAAFTEAGAKAIEHGADMNRVVNARLGMKTLGGKVRTRNGKLLPQEIMRLAGNDRQKALRLLRQNGYLRYTTSARRAA